MSPVVLALGGVRGTIFAAIAAIALAGVGVQTFRLKLAEGREAKFEAAVAIFRSAQTTNLGTIQVLRNRLQILAEARRAERAAQAAAVERAQANAQALQDTLEARTRELENLYDRDPEARRWADDGPPADLLRQLPGGQD